MEVQYKVMTNSFDFRLEIMRSAQQFVVSETARMFGISRPTVYKWVQWYRLESLKGLNNRATGLITALMRLCENGRSRAKFVLNVKSIASVLL